jgi:archaetidylinositol phosphate synthase
MTTQITGSSLSEYCEHTDPGILGEVRRGGSGFSNAQRFQQSLVAVVEKRALIWMAERTPGWINSDHLTAVGFFAQILAGACYALSRWNPYALLGVVGCLAINWLGDSLDGTLARVRQQQRPRYGFYVDHMIDSFGALFLMGGLALSGYMHPYIAIGLLLGFLLLSIQSYLATYTLGEFHLSFWRFGPTELRLLLALGNLVVLFRPMALGGRYRLFDVGGTIGLLGMSLILVFFSAHNAYRLYIEERIQ